MAKSKVSSTTINLSARAAHQLFDSLCTAIEGLAFYQGNHPPTLVVLSISESVAASLAKAFGTSAPGPVPLVKTKKKRKKK
jgi:hypothetical protein